MFFLALPLAFLLLLVGLWLLRPGRRTRLTCRRCGTVRITTGSGDRRVRRYSVPESTEDVLICQTVGHKWPRL